jgi:hypothetical protein
VVCARKVLDIQKVFMDAPAPKLTLALALPAAKIYRTNGVRGLYAGLCPTLIGMIPYTTCYFFMYDTIKTSYCRIQKKSSLTRPELVVIGAPSGKR